MRQVKLIAHFVHEEHSLLKYNEPLEASCQEPESMMLHCEVAITLILCGFFYFGDHFTFNKLLPSIESILHPFIDIFPSPKPSRPYLSPFLECFSQATEPLLILPLLPSSASVLRSHSLAWFAFSLFGLRLPISIFYLYVFFGRIMCLILLRPLLWHSLQPSQSILYIRCRTLLLD